MKKRLVQGWMVGFSAMFLWSMSAAGADKMAAQRREQDEESAAAELDREAKNPANAQHATQRLTEEFGVKESQINSLREQGLGYGEIHHALSIAQRMPGGITDENLNHLLTLRQEQHRGWGEISTQTLGTPLGRLRAREPSAAAIQPSLSTIPQHSAERELEPARSSHPRSTMGGFEGGSSWKSELGGEGLGRRGGPPDVPGHRR